MAKPRIRFKCGGCSAKYDSATKISRHWDRFPKHMTEKQAKTRKYRLAGQDISPLPTTEASQPRQQKSWKHCPWCGGKLR